MQDGRLTEVLVFGFNRNKKNNMKKLALYSLLVLLNIPVKAQEYKLFAASVEGKVQLKWMTKNTKAMIAFDVFRMENGSWQKLNAIPIVPSEVIKPTELKTSKNKFPNDEAYEMYISYHNTREASANKQAYADYLLAINSIYNNRLAFHRGMYFEDALAQKDKTYAYKLVEVNSQKELSSIQGVRVGELGKAPQNLTAKQKKQSIALTWEVNPDYIAYAIYRNGSKINDEPVLPNADKGEYLVNYTDLNVPAGTYGYVVKGITFLNTETESSAELKVVVKDNTPPINVKGFKAVRKNDEVFLTWNKTLDKEAKGYNIFRSEDKGKTFRKINSEVLAVNNMNYNDKITSEISGTLQYQLETIDQSNNGNKTNPASVFIPDHQAPSKPNDLKGKSEVGKITLTWRPNTEKDLAGYRIYRGLKDNDQNEMQLLNVTPQTVTSFVDTFNEKAGTKFIYKVAALDKSFNESEKAIAWIQLPDVIAPSAPYLREATYQKNQVVLKWDAITNDAILGYDVYRIMAEKEVKLNKEPLSTTTFNDQEVVSKGILQYYVKAVDSVRLVSKPSNKISVSTANFDAKALKISVSQDLRARKVVLTYEGVLADDVQIIKLFRKAGESGFVRIPFKEITNGLLDETSEEGKIYEYYIEILTRDEVKIKSEKVSINNSF